jgi:hypothetical protein
VFADFSLCHLVNHQISNPTLVQVHYTTLQLAASAHVYITQLTRNFKFYLQYLSSPVLRQAKQLSDIIHSVTVNADYVKNKRGLLIQAFRIQSFRDWQ